MKNTTRIAPFILEHLSRDPILKSLIDSRQLKERPSQPSVYEALIRSIVFQQLSGASASSIHRRFLNLFEDEYPDPLQILDLHEQNLRQVGLSRQKISYIQNTAQFFLENNLRHAPWEKMSDEAIIDQLTQIKGVGQWTVEMILMFTLHRPDVLPLDDLVIKTSMITLYDVENYKGKALHQKLIKIAEPWRPYRTTACRYLWQWKDTVL